MKVTKKVIKCKKINCQFFDSRHSPEDPMLISSPVPEINAYNLLHRVSILTVDYAGRRRPRGPETAKLKGGQVEIMKIAEQQEDNFGRKLATQSTW